MNEEVISLFDDGLKGYIEELLSSRIGLGSRTVDVCNVDTGVASHEKQASMRGDRFQLVVPYAGDNLVWDVVFDAANPTYPPDFGFDDDFLSDAEANVLEESLPSLANWDGNDPKALLHVVEELLTLYRKYQISLLDVNEHGRLIFEYSALVGETNVEENDIEVLVATRQSVRTRQANHGVHFLIRLNVDFTDLPPINKTDNVGESAALLLVVFHAPQWSRIVPQLILSPAVEMALGKSSSFNIPRLPQRECLMDYVPLIEKQVKDKINSVIFSYQKREQFITVLLFRLGESVLEYDLQTFTQASFLLTKKDFYFLLNVSLSSTFPKEGPVFLLQSVYDASHGKPFKRLCKDCPYSPRWSAPELVEFALGYLWEEVDIFQKKSSIQSCSLFG